MLRSDSFEERSGFARNEFLNYISKMYFVFFSIIVGACAGLEFLGGLVGEGVGEWRMFYAI